MRFLDWHVVPLLYYDTPLELIRLVQVLLLRFQVRLEILAALSARDARGFVYLGVHLRFLRHNYMCVVRLLSLLGPGLGREIMGLQVDFGEDNGGVIVVRSGLVPARQASVGTRLLGEELALKLARHFGARLLPMN